MAAEEYVGFVFVLLKKKSFMPQRSKEVKKETTNTHTHTNAYNWYFSAGQYYLRRRL